MLLAFLQKNIVNVAMRMEEEFYNIFMYLYNKNILEYAEISRSGYKSMIHGIEGLSNNFVKCENMLCNDCYFHMK